MVSLVTAIGIIVAGLSASPAVAGDNGVARNPATEEQKDAAHARAGDPYEFREHSTADNARVDLSNDRIDKVWDLHKVNFTVLVRVVEWARSPRMDTSAAGDDRGIYRYRICEYETDNGALRKTGRWMIIQFVIEWGNDEPGSGWLVTAYPVETQAGNPPKNSATGKMFCPAWLANSVALGPVNNDILY